MERENFTEKLKSLNCERKKLEMEIKNMRIRLSQIIQQIEIMRTECPNEHISSERCELCGGKYFSDLYK